MELSSSDCSKHNCCKHLDVSHHPSGRPMQDQTSLFSSCSRILLILFAVGAMILPVLAQTSISTLPSTTVPTPQNGISQISQQSPFLGGPPTGKTTAK